jgi:K+-sensing histidine kinase KdpD
MLLSIYRHHQCAENRTLALVEPVHNFLLKSDQELLTRILGNLIKNALEAPPEAATVRIDCRSGDDETIFSINNPGEMPKELQTRVFPAAGRPRAAAAAWACAVSACWSAHAVAKLTWSAIPQRGRLSCSTCQWLRGR